MKDEVREATATEVWQLWTDEWNLFAQLRQSGPPLLFPAEVEVLGRFSNRCATRKSCFHCATRGIVRKYIVEEPREESRTQRHPCTLALLTTCC